MTDSVDSSAEQYWTKVLGTGGGRLTWRAAPLKSNGPMYWHAAARILKVGDQVTKAVLALKGPVGEPRRLGLVEQLLVSGELADADQVLDAVRDLVECTDDDDGSAAAKSYLAGWICADVVGRCLA